MTARRLGPRLLAVAVAAVVLAACVGVGPPRGAASMRADPASFVLAVPEGGGLVVPVRIAGVGEPLPFLIDTGSTRTALYPWAAERAGLAADGAGLTRVRSVGDLSDRPLVLLERLDLGEASWSPLPVILLEPSALRPDIAGIIGTDVLAGFAMLWSPEDDEIVLVPTERFDRRAFSGWSDLATTSATPLDAEGRLLFGRTRLNLRDVFVMIDTGSDSSLMNWEAAEISPLMRLLRRRLEEQWRLEGASGTFMPTALARLPELEVGEQVWARPELFVLDLAPVDSDGRRSLPLIVLGTDLLLDRPFVIDFGSRATFVAPADPAGEGNGRGQGGEDGTVKVEGPSSPAAAWGITAGW